MIVTKTGRCVIVDCGAKVKEQREFEAAPKLVEVPCAATPGLPKELIDRIREWRDKPILCAEHSMHEIRKVVA